MLTVNYLNICYHLYHFKYSHCLSWKLHVTNIDQSVLFCSRLSWCELVLRSVFTVISAQVQVLMDELVCCDCTGLRKSFISPSCFSIFSLEQILNNIPFVCLWLSLKRPSGSRLDRWLRVCVDATLAVCRLLTHTEMNVNQCDVRWKAHQNPLSSSFNRYGLIWMNTHSFIERYSTSQLGQTLHGLCNQIGRAINTKGKCQPHFRPVSACLIEVWKLSDLSVFGIKAFLVSQQISRDKVWLMWGHTCFVRIKRLTKRTKTHKGHSLASVTNGQFELMTTCYWPMEYIKELFWIFSRYALLMLWPGSSLQCFVKLYS